MSAAIEVKIDPATLDKLESAIMNILKVNRSDQVIEAALNAFNEGSRINAYISHNVFQEGQK